MKKGGSKVSEMGDLDEFSQDGVISIINAELEGKK
jgi:hypothetical protein